MTQRHSRFLHSYGIVDGTFGFWKWWALPRAFSAYQRLWKPAFLPSVPKTPCPAFSTVCFSHCDSHVVSAKTSTSVKKTVLSSPLMLCRMKK